MTPSNTQSILRLTALATSIAATTTGMAQEALRASLTGEAAATARREARANPSHNIKAGPVKLNLSASLDVEYNSNVQFSDTAVDDVILRPMLHTDAYLPFSDLNALHISVGLGYLAYLNQSELNYFTVEPGSDIAFDVFSGDFLFTVYDRFSYSLDPALNGAIANTARYGGFRNTAGLDVIWDQNDFIARLGYGYEIFQTDRSDQFSYQDRGTHLIPARVDFLVNDMFTIGPEANFGYTTYTEDILPPTTELSAGGFVQARLSHYFSASLHAGYVGVFLKPDGTPLTDDTYNTWYASADVRHRVNPWFTYSISGGREVQLGTFSAYDQIWFARWSGQFDVIERTGFSVGFGYEDSSQPEQAYERPDGELVLFLGQDYTRFNANVGLTRELMPQLSASLRYNFLHRLGGSNAINYDNHVIALGATYVF